ncbi:MAG: M20/M25/M40 family metallo-hydrolase [Chloroflexi bacterium]|jgi:glutamate carboxypeptidase|nr:M20/M25/M40 family metallo-hydrolase [Chloroflexota bacterium]
MNEVNQTLSYLQKQRDAMIAFLSKLVLAESPSSSPEAQALPLTILWEMLDELGFGVQLIPGKKTGGQLLARLKAQDSSDGVRQQLLIGHCDTVWPMGTLKEMPLEVEGNVVRGPGVFDMKGGLTQMVFALKAVLALGHELQVAPVVFVNSDEEIGSRESRSYIIRLAKQVQRAFILEPALGVSGKLKTARKGVGRFDVVVRGKAAHAGLDPEKGISAILALSHVIQELYTLNDLQEGISVNVGLIEGGLQSNVIAPEGRATVDVRVPTKAEVRRLEESIMNLEPPMPGISLEIEGGFNRPPLEPTLENQALWHAAQELGHGLGLALEQGMAGGGSDGNYTSLYTATLDGLGAVGDGAHAQHEFLYIDKMIERTALLAQLLLRP